jgi:hypothetical protein
MPEETFLIFYSDTAENELAPFDKAVNIIAVTYSH